MSEDSVDLPPFASGGFWPGVVLGDCPSGLGPFEGEGHVKPVLS